MFQNISTDVVSSVQDENFEDISLKIATCLRDHQLRESEKLSLLKKHKKMLKGFESTNLLTMDQDRNGKKEREPKFYKLRKAKFFRASMNELIRKRYK